MHGLRYHPAVVRDDIPKLSSDVKTRIKDAVERKLTTSPEIYGIPLRTSLKGYRKLRVGDYRIVYKINNNLVFILAIRHRSQVYSRAEKRT